jgi:phospholipase/carboxylesterase
MDIPGEIIDALTIIEKFQRAFHPPLIDRLKKKLKPHYDALSGVKEKLENSHNGNSLRLTEAATLLRESLNQILTASNIDFQPLIISVMKGYRKYNRALELLFELRNKSDYLNRFFGEPQQPLQDTEAGILHYGLEEDPYARGGYSLFVPEGYSSSRPAPVITALHGGFSHGKDFIWTWMREARSRGYILVAPTSSGSTWSISEPETDIELLNTIIGSIREKWNIDTERILVTGLSDGGTFALACAMATDTPFTAFGAVSCTMPLHGIENLKDKNIYRIHGTADWMFPFYNIEREMRILESSGANIILRKIENLSHTYPREENTAMLDWLESL